MQTGEYIWRTVEILRLLVIRRCAQEGNCDDLLFDSLDRSRYNAFSGVFVIIMLYIYYYIYKRYKQSHRLTCDKIVYEELLHEMKKYECLFRRISFIHFYLENQQFSNEV